MTLTPLKHMMNRHANRRGAMLILVLLVMVLLLVAAVFSVDVAQMHLARAELRTATDAAARAGTEALARTDDPELAIQAALDAAARNDVFGEGLELRREDIILGTQVPGPNGSTNFVAEEPFSSVRVIGRRDGAAPQGPVPLMFANIFGVSDFSPVQTAVASASVIDIALVLDRSGSMDSLENGVTRIDSLKDAVSIFINEIEDSSPNTRVSLVSYSTQSTTDIALTDNLQQIIAETNAFVPDGFTNIFQALRDGSDTLLVNNGGRLAADKVVILMTDGNFNVGGTPIPSANLTADRNHTIHTITFSSGANQGIMQQVANIGNGDHIHADNGDDLAAAFREIARSLAVRLTE